MDGQWNRKWVNKYVLWPFSCLSFNLKTWSQYRSISWRKEHSLQISVEPLLEFQFGCLNSKLWECWVCVYWVYADWNSYQSKFFSNYFSLNCLMRYINTFIWLILKFKFEGKYWAIYQYLCLIEGVSKLWNSLL